MNNGLLIRRLPVIHFTLFILHLLKDINCFLKTVPTLSEVGTVFVWGL
jgi:hypothetical protein